MVRLTGGPEPAGLCRWRRLKRVALSTAVLASSVFALPTAPESRAELQSPPHHAPASGWTEDGQASWYGSQYHGRLTASGETFDMGSMTAAHKSLPFGTWVEVENLSNGKTVRVRINDRGPFAEDRVIDLASAAADQLVFVSSGVVQVRLTVISPPGERLGESSRVQQETGQGAKRGEADASRDRGTATATAERPFLRSERSALWPAGAAFGLPVRAAPSARPGDKTPVPGSGLRPMPSRVDAPDSEGAVPSVLLERPLRPLAPDFQAISDRRVWAALDALQRPRIPPPQWAGSSNPRFVAVGAHQVSTACSWDLCLEPQGFP